MQDPKFDLINAFKLEKRLQVFISVYLSIILISIILIIVIVDMTAELQQALVIVLGLITIATLDAFKKAIANTQSSFVNEFKQIIIQNGGSYIDGIDRRVSIQDGNYVVDGNINYGSDKRQTLAEAAAEIQELLQQLEQSNPSATEAEKVAYVNDEAEPDLKSRVVSALKSGGEVAIENSLDSHYINIIKAIIKGWVSSQ
ncbi:hypothetical protein NIES2100_13110 [Calothrix sp. NIES-2100]|uniref:hypothetical protein n=1 Tax=Calothrix sp. NIES-2100 TaxID=1954172 RepID=UPI000B60EB7B|nr:hypothetical protein NIES2100_13110 [Calothrix sp. NIES-2100]